MEKTDLETKKGGISQITPYLSAAAFLAVVIQWGTIPPAKSQGSPRVPVIASAFFLQDPEGNPVGALTAEEDGNPKLILGKGENRIVMTVSDTNVSVELSTDRRQSGLWVELDSGKSGTSRIHLNKKGEGKREVYANLDLRKGYLSTMLAVEADDDSTGLIHSMIMPDGALLKVRSENWAIVGVSTNDPGSKLSSTCLQRIRCSKAE